MDITQTPDITLGVFYGLCPAFGGEGIVQFVGVMTASKLQTAGFGVCLAVGHSFGHLIAFVQLVQQNKPPLFFGDGVIYPELAFWHEFIDVVMPAGGEVDVENAAYELAIHDPDPDAIFQRFPQSFVSGICVGQLFAVVCHFL